MPLCAAITNTMGGIVVNGDGAVLDTNDKPIPGLYAAGSTIGGLNGGPHVRLRRRADQRHDRLARGGGDCGSNT